MRQLVVGMFLTFAVVSAAAPVRAAGKLPVPGLSREPTIAAGAADLPAPGPPPKVEQCIQAWNLHAPRATLRWVAARRPYGAHVGSGKDFNRTMVVGVSGWKYVSGPTCNLLVSYGHNGFLDVTGIWKHGAVTGWWGFAGANYPDPFQQNTLVAADGTMHLPSSIPVHVPATVPALPDLVKESGDVPAPGPKPTAPQCVKAWNTDAPKLMLDWIGGLRPYGAFVEISKRVLSTTVTDSNGTRTVVVSGPQCDVRVLFGADQDTEIEGVWKDGAVSAWSGSIGTFVLDHSPQNASVAADGSLRLR